MIGIHSVMMVLLEHGMEVFNEYTEAKHIAMTLVNQREYRQNIKLLFS